MRFQLVIYLFQGSYGIVRKATNDDEVFVRLACGVGVHTACLLIIATVMLNCQTQLPLNV